MAAAAVSAPAIAASPPETGPVPNDDANYYWDNAAGTRHLYLEPEAGDLKFHLTSEISFRNDAGGNPPAGVNLQVVLELSSPVEVLSLSSGAWTVTPDSGTSSTFTFVTESPGWGVSISGRLRGTEAGEITARASMSLLNPGEYTWSEEAVSDNGVLVQ